jgi:hypothetical protein
MSKTITIMRKYETCQEKASSKLTQNGQYTSMNLCSVGTVAGWIQLTVLPMRLCI